MPEISDWEMTPNMEQQQPPSVIQEFYTGQTILLTGITGFIGQCLVEKLLRSCPGIEKIYTIVRQKKSLSVEERMKTYFNQPIFNRLREENPNCMDKLVPLEGDLLLPNLGLSSDTRRLLIENVNLIIHNGASVMFFQRISKILKINVLGTEMILQLASECSHLRAFMYVSTGYSQSHNYYTEERCYEPPGDLKMVHDIIAADTISETGMSEAALNQCLSYCHNNYIFSKAITENLVQQYSRKAPFPCGIFRPTIVFSAAKDPAPGWVDNLNGPTLQYLGHACGFLHYVLLIGQPVIDYVPVDMTCNSLITFAWKLATIEKPQVKCYVYHYTSGQFNPTTLKQQASILSPYVHENPTIRSVWYPSVTFIENEVIFYILHYLMHVLPAILFDIYRIARGRKPFFINNMRKGSKNVAALLRFSTVEFAFETKEWSAMWELLNSTDREIFFSDIRQLDWKFHARSTWDWIRKNILHETDEDLLIARRRIFWLKILHYAICTFVKFAFLYFLYSLVCRILGL